MSVGADGSPKPGAPKPGGSAPDPGGHSSPPTPSADLAGPPAARHGAVVSRDAFHWVTVNGQRREVPVGGSAHDLVVALGLAGRPLAVEVDGRVVPRARLADCMLESESVIEIVTLVGGG